MLRPGIPADVRRDLSQCRTHLWEVASTVAELTDAGRPRDEPAQP